MWVCSSQLQESLLNEWNEASVSYVLDGHGPPVLDLTGHSVTCEEDNGRGDPGEFYPHHEKSKAIEEDRAEEIEESHSPSRLSGRAGLRSVHTSDTVMVAAEDHDVQGSHERPRKERMEAEAKRNARFHRKESPLDSKFLAPGQGCNPL